MVEKNQSNNFAPQEIAVGLNFDIDFESIVKSSSEAFAIRNPDGMLLYANQAYAQLLETQQMLLQQTNYRDFYPPESIEIINGVISPVLAKGYSWEGELDIISTTGKRLTVWEKDDVILDDTGNILFAFCLMHDISERKKSERALYINELRLRNAERIGKYGSFVLSLIQEETWWSEQLHEMLGLDMHRQKLSLEAFEHHIFSDDLKRWKEAIASLKSSSKSQSIELELRIVTKNETEKWIKIAFCSITNESSPPTEISGVIRDVTDDKLMEKAKLSQLLQLQQTQKLESMGVLAGGIAHDFNNLLMAILGNADLAQHCLDTSQPAKRNVTEIQKAAQRAAELCKQMLAYSGRDKFAISSVDLSALVQELTILVDASISKRINRQFDLDPTLPTIHGDTSQLRQVIMTLIVNASDAIGNNSGQIRVSTGTIFCDRNYLDKSYLTESLEEGEYVYLEVSDTGCGMDQHTLERIFDPFFTTKFSGRGMGLAAVLGIIRSHSGTIMVSSEVNKGSNFKVLLPAIRETKVTQETTLHVATSLVGKVILLVDDDESVRTIAKTMLENLGCITLVAQNGHQAIDIYKDNRDSIACVLLDLTMPDLDGEETLAELRRINSKVLIILSSGYDEMDISRRFRNKRLSGVMQKPYTLDKLQNKLIESLK